MTPQTPESTVDPRRDLATRTAQREAHDVHDVHDVRNVPDVPRGLEGGPHDVPRELDAEVMLQRIASQLLGETPSDVWIGRFRVVKTLGEGGMGIVYEANDGKLDRKVAIKAIRGDRLRMHPSERTRLLREAQALAKLSHPNVVQIHEVDDAGAAIFVVMEHVEGTTLGKWLETTRSLSAILTAFIAAGRGLEAAHQVGIVHRDFKPGNVLVGIDGRVRIADFGLARGDPTPASTTSPRLAHSESSAEHTIVTAAHGGTPAYMSPEQILGVPCDGRSDQFSFCVALYEAIYKKRPFATGELAARLEDKRPLTPNFAGPAPRWLRRVLARGLALRPEDRYPTITDLLASLETIPKRRRQATSACLAGLTLAGAVTTGVLLSTSASPLCPDASVRLDNIWAENQRVAVQRAFTGTGLSYAATAAKRVVTALDIYREDWVAARQEACEATQVRGERSASALDHSMLCLERARRSLANLTDVLVEATPAVVGEADALVRALPELAACADLELLEPSPLAPPRDDPELDQKLDRARILEGTRQGPEAAALLEEIVVLSQQAGDPGREGEALQLLGRIYSLLLRDPQRAKNALHRAYDQATIAGRHDLVWSVWSELAWVTGYELDDHENARIDLAHAKSASTGSSNPEVEPTLLAVESGLLTSEGDFTGAVQRRGEVVKALELRTRPEPIRLMQARNELATAIANAGRNTEALQLRHDLWKDANQQLGADHPVTAHIEMNLGFDYYELHDVDPARRHLEHSRTAIVATFSASNPWVALIDLRLAQIEEALGAHATAIARARTARSTFEHNYPPTHSDRVTTLEVLSELYRETNNFEAQLEVSRALLAAHDASNQVEMDVGGVLINIAESLCELKRCPEALPYLNQLKALYQTHPPEDAAMLAFPAFGFGRVHMAQGNPRLAVLELEDAYTVFRTARFDRAGQRENLAAAASSLADALAAVHQDPQRVRALRREAARLDTEAKAEAEVKAEAAGEPVEPAPATGDAGATKQPGGSPQ